MFSQTNVTLQFYYFYQIKHCKKMPYFDGHSLTYVFLQICYNHRFAHVTTNVSTYFCHDLTLFTYFFLFARMRDE